MATSVPGAAHEPLSHDSGAPDEAIRHTFIGGSEAFELLYQKQYGRGCARALAYRKLQYREDVPSASQTERALEKRAILNRGHYLEDLAARLYMDNTGRALIRRTKLVRHISYPGAGVHTDRIILAHRVINGDSFIEKPTGDAEIKTHAEGPFYNILRNGLPPAHNLQLQWSLFCTGHEWGAFIILGVFGSLPLKHFDVQRDEETMGLFAKATEEFWGKLQAGDLPPKLTDPSDIRCKLCPYRLTCRGEEVDPQEYARFMQDKDRKRPLTHIQNDELDEALTDRALILSEMEALDHESDTDPGALQLVTKRIRELLGDQDAVEVNDRFRVYHSEIVWSGLDQQRLRFEQPDIHKKYYITQRPTGKKRLRVYALSERKQ
jgi:predicted phage-related endonuclease